MRKREALTLKPGDRVQFSDRDAGPVMIVQEVIPQPTPAEPIGTFPLVLVENNRLYGMRGGCTYRLLKRL